MTYYSDSGSPNNTVRDVSFYKGILKSVVNYTRKYSFFLSSYRLLLMDITTVEYKKLIPPSIKLLTLTLI